MTKEITLRCKNKNCGKPFQYNEEAYRLIAEKGESRFLRCPECRQPHGREIREVKTPYFSLEKRTGLSLHRQDYTLHGERILQEKEKEKIDYSKNLTITDEEILTLYQLLEENQVVILAAPTGAGKSTFVPARLIKAPEDYTGDFIERLIHQGQIIITEPRITATKKVAITTAEMAGSSIGSGGLIGYRYSEEDQSDHWNLAKQITDGTLPNWIREEKLGQYSLIMVDEAHERSCNIDWILGSLRRELPKYSQLRVLIASATINTQKFLDFFKEANVSTEIFDLSFLEKRRKHKAYIHFWKVENAYRLSKEGRLEKVDDCNCWLCQKPKKEKEKFWRNQKDTFKEFELPEVAANLVSKILEETKEGDILVFLHGEKAINETTQKIIAKERKDLVKVIPAYRRIQAEVEEELKQETKKRRVIIGTNLLETSLTLDRATYEIESGYIKEAQWDPETQISTLPTESHSQDGRKQRWGRLGRTENGYIYNLYTKEEFEKAEEHTLPESTRSCLEDSLVNLKGAGVVKVDQFPWLEKPSQHPKMEKEIARAQRALKERDITDQKGEITERALELLGIPRSSTEATFLFLADGNGSLFEAMITLWLMATREGEVRTGANLYSSSLGLLCWESNWKAETKAGVWAIHQGLRIGCRDDLDFVTKLIICFRRAGVQSQDRARKWAERHFINYENFQKISSEIDELITERFGEEREESVRKIDATQLERIRVLMASVWPEKIINLESGEPITYPVAGETKMGVVTRLCAGNWQRKKQAIVAAAVEEKAIVDGHPKKVPTASFMVQLPAQERTATNRILFIDQKFPVGSWVEVKEENGRFYLSELLKLPLPVKVSHRKTFNFPEDYPEEISKKEEKISFPKEDFLVEAELPVSLEGIWAGKQKAEKARIIEWVERDGQTVAVLNPFEESLEIKDLGKKRGETLKVKIQQVSRDPIGKNGWIIVRTEKGFNIPVELSEMSLSPWGPGLERVEGQTLSLIIKDFDEVGFPQLSNIDKIIEDLKTVRKEISEKNIFPGEVIEINKEEENAVAIIGRKDGVVHPFEIYKNYVPGKEISNLRIGEKVMVSLSLPKTERDHIQADWLTKTEIDNIPILTNWEYDEKKGEVSFPYCLEDRDFENWPARPEAIDFVKRHSWQYCFAAKIKALKEKLSKLNEMDEVEGIITQIDYEEDGRTIKSVQVVVEDNIPGGFAFGSDLGSISVSEGDKIVFYVKAVDPNSGFLRLVSKQSEEEKRKKQEEFVRRTLENIQRWEDNIKKAEEIITRKEKIIAKRRENIAQNRVKASQARDRQNKEWENRFNFWIEKEEREIEEEERKIRDIKRSIQDWSNKIDSARSKLKERER